MHSEKFDQEYADFFFLDIVALNLYNKSNNIIKIFIFRWLHNRDASKYKYKNHLHKNQNWLLITMFWSTRTLIWEFLIAK